MLHDDEANEEDIKKAIDYTAEKRVTQNVLGYVRSALRNRYWETVSIPTTTKKATNRTEQSSRSSRFYDSKRVDKESEKLQEGWIKKSEEEFMKETHRDKRYAAWYELFPD